LYILKFRAKLFYDWRNISPILGFGFGYSETGETCPNWLNWRNWRNLPKLAKLAKLKM
jgi:hypothetical protein